MRALVTGGHEAVVLRGLARELEVTAPALYDHFENKGALLQALAEVGYEQLVHAIEAADRRAIDRIRRRALGYVGFAAENPELFGLMFQFRPAALEVLNGAGVVVDNELAAATEAFEIGAADLALAIADGDLVDRDPAELAMIMWTATHGVATVALLAPAIAEATVEDVIDTILAGLQP